tara:strand:+ start:514 stop:732 length:219 start_codon:yes stop_codon:yes gene_type:complete
MPKKQTCLKPIYEKKGKNKSRRIDRYEFDFPEIITEDLGFEMMFGFPEPKDLPKKFKGKEYEWPINRKFYNY